MASPILFAWLTQPDSSLSPPSHSLMREVPFPYAPTKLCNHPFLPGITLPGNGLWGFWFFFPNLSPPLDWELLEDQDFGLVIATPRAWHKHNMSQRKLSTTVVCGNCPFILYVRKSRPRERKEHNCETQGVDKTGLKPCIPHDKPRGHRPPIPVSHRGILMS